MKCLKMSEEMFTIKPSSFNDFRFRQEEFQFQSSDSFMVSNLCEIEREKNTNPYFMLFIQSDSN